MVVLHIFEGNIIENDPRMDWVCLSGSQTTSGSRRQLADVDGELREARARLELAEERLENLGATVDALRRRLEVMASALRSVQLLLSSGSAAWKTPEWDHCSSDE